jgi:hypothetical protein
MNHSLKISQALPVVLLVCAVASSTTACAAAASPAESDLLIDMLRLGMLDRDVGQPEAEGGDLVVKVSASHARSGECAAFHGTVTVDGAPLAERANDAVATDIAADGRCAPTTFTLSSSQRTITPGTVLAVRVSDERGTELHAARVAVP